jgi:hypothetical protein
MIYKTIYVSKDWVDGMISIKCSAHKSFEWAMPWNLWKMSKYIQ